MGKFLLLFISLQIAFSTISCSSYIEALFPGCPLGEAPQICDSDGKGLKMYFCRGPNDYRPARYGRKRCGKNAECQCYMDEDSNDDPGQRCKCVNTKKLPSFPSYGVIRWTGYDQREDETERRVEMSGEVHKDTNGNFLLKGKFRYRWFDNFKIITPNKDGQTFTEYTYTDASNKVCKSKTVKTSGSLEDIWWMKGEFEFKNEEMKEKDTIEVWQRERVWGDLTDNTYLTVKYDETTKQVVPTKYYHNMWDFKNLDIVVKLDYTYEAIADEKTTFKLSDYCKKFEN